MARNSKNYRSLKQLIQTVPSEEETTKILDALAKGKPSHYTDRAVAVIASTLLDSALKVAILARFVELKSAETNQLFDGSSGGPLSSFSAKIRIAFALGIISDTQRDDLNRIRAVRNAFAHSIVAVSFRTQAVIQECKKLSMMSQKGSARDRYTVTVAFLMGYLEGFAIAVVAGRSASQTSP